MPNAYSQDTTPNDKLPKLNSSNLKRLLVLGKSHWTSLGFAAFILIFSTLISLSLPIIAQNAINGVSKTGISALDHAVELATILLLISGSFTFLEYVIVARAGNRIVMETRLKLFHSLQRLKVGFFDQHRSGDLTSTLSNDVSLLQTSLTDDLVKFGGNILQLLGGIVLAFVLDWRLTLFVVILLVLLMAYFIMFGIRLRKLSRKSLEELSKAMGSMTEALANIRLVKAFVREDHEDRKAASSLQKVFDLNMKASISEGLMTAIGNAGSLLMIVGVVWFGGGEVFNHRLSVGSLVGFLIDVAIIGSPTASLGSLYTRLQRAVGAADRIFRFLDEEREPASPSNPVSFPQDTIGVHFDQVSFGYRPDVPVIKNLSLNLEAGKVTAIVGGSGAGKSTLAALLFRFFDPNSGRVKIGDIDIRNFSLSDLREQVGYVPQDTVLFSGTLFENLVYGRLDATEEEALIACKSANLGSFVAQLPEGLQTLIGERGVTVSGGQRQRIAIARVLLKNPRILVLDEATSALDTVSESQVKEAIDRAMKGRTTMVIAHRLTTIQSADQIAVIEHGSIEEIGTHSELMSNNARYAELYRMIEAEAVVFESTPIGSAKIEEPA